LKLRCSCGEVGWSGWPQHVRSVSRSAANSRQWWQCVPVPVTSSCQTTSIRSRPSRILSGAPERCKVRHYLHTGRGIAIRASRNPKITVKKGNSQCDRHCLISDITVDY
jgi:hypothetical protein